MRLLVIHARALFLGFVLLCSNPALSENSVSTTGGAQLRELLAAGQIAAPANVILSGSGQNVAATRTGLFTHKERQADTAAPTIFDLFPPSRENASKPDLPVQINIEYDESLAPTSNSPGLSVVKAMNEALVNGPRAAAIRAQMSVARANLAQATQAPNPVFFFDRGIVAEQVNRMGPVLTIEPPWKLLFRLISAGRLVDQTKIDLLTQIWSLRADARRAYVEVVVAQETQRNLETLYDLSDKLLTVTSKRFKAGAVPQLDVLKARLSSSQAAVDVNVGKRRVLKARQQLNILMGRAADVPLHVAPLPDFTSEKSRVELRAEISDILPDFSRDVPPLKEFIEKGLNNRLELKSLAVQLSVNQANLEKAYGNIIPNPSLAFGKSTAGNPPSGPKLNAVFFTLNAEIPLSNANQGAIWSCRATARQLHYQVGATRNLVMADVSAAYNNLLAARKKLRVYQDKLLTDSNVVAHLSRRSYEVGQSDITSALNAQQANVQTQYAYLDAVAAYGAAFTDLEFSTGRPLQ